MPPDLFDQFGVKPPETKAKPAETKTPDAPASADAQAGGDLFTQFKVAPPNAREAMRPRGAEVIEQTPGMKLPTSPGGAGNTLQTADDIMRNVAGGATFGGADKLAAFIDSQFGKGSYDELLAKQRQETEQSGDRLGPVGQFLAQAAGGMLTGSGLARQGLTLLGKLPATASLPMKMLAGSGEGSLYGAASGALHTDTGKLEDYLKNAGIGGLLGAATGSAVPAATAGVQKVITPFPTSDPVRAAAMKTLSNADVDVSAGVKTGSPKLRMAEDVVSKMPLGGPLPGQQMAQVTENVMKKAGIGGSGGAATPDVVAKGFETVGGKINALQKPYAVPVDDTLLNAAAKVESETKPLVEQGQQGPLQHFIDKITSSQQLSPDMAQAIRTQLNEAIKDATGQHQTGLIQLKNALDDALTRTMQKAGDDAGVEALKQARNQYAHLHILSDALSMSGAAGMKGELTPSALARAVQRSVGRKDFFSGSGDLNDLARASAGYLQPPKDSGTATREGYQNPAKWALGAAGRVGINNPVAQKYWGNQVAPPASGAQMQPSVPGLISAGAPPNMGPADRLMQSAWGLLGPRP